MHTARQERGSGRHESGAAQGERPGAARQRAIVFQYDAESSSRVAELERIELLLTTMTLVKLTLEGLFVFRPAVHVLRKLIADLADDTAPSAG